MQTLTENMKYYAYYLEAYTAVLGGMVGTYEIQEPAENGSLSWVAKYGLKAFSPIAKHFPYQDYDDFGVSRSYGFKRQHLGHDMMGQVGTPVIAVESGYVEAIGWNQYGGWRLGIRSFDKKRYYYYAHLRKNYPCHKALKEGSIVQAGDVIGYLGRTGYSRTENTNNIDEPHLHFGLQLIFDESQKDGNNEIWIDCYQLVRFLQLNRSETKKDPETKEYSRVLEMRDPAFLSQSADCIFIQIFQPRGPRTSHMTRITMPITGSSGIISVRIPPIMVSTSVKNKITTTTARSFQYHLFRL